jgi:hypothetical protein
MKEKGWRETKSITDAKMVWIAAIGKRDGMREL